MLNDLKKRFNEDGFIVVRDVFKPSEIEFYREVVQEAIKERKQLDLRQLEDKSKYEQSFTQCQNLWEDYPEIRKLTFDQRICKIAAELLDVKAIRIWHDQALVKEAGGVINEIDLTKHKNLNVIASSTDISGKLMEKLINF